MSLTPEQMVAAVLAIPSGGNLMIHVFAPNGATVTAAKDGQTYIAAWDSGNSLYAVYVPDYGTYTVAVTWQGDTWSKAVTLTRKNVTFRCDIPSAYQELEYLQSTGTQYLNVGLRSEDGHRYECDVMVDVYMSESRFFGAHTNRPYGRDEFGYWDPSANHNWVIGTPINLYRASATPELNRKYHLDVCTISNHQSLAVDGVSLEVVAANTGSQSLENLDRYMFAENYMGSVGQWFVGKIYGPFTAYDTLQATEPVAQFYPVKRISDDKPGMYDVVRDIFYTNQGTGEFIMGPEIV